MKWVLVVTLYSHGFGIDPGIIQGYTPKSSTYTVQMPVRLRFFSDAE